jgi:site-specific DNA recombinase
VKSALIVRLSNGGEHRAAMRSSVPKPKTLRCAIYTRKSSEEGLEQDFNSLQAQRESCEAYIKSQKHEGWAALPSVYDDGGFSGGSMDRPALKRLLADIQSKSVDVVVVYKVDRLTRSLADFAKIVEVFDAAGVSFVSVTQQFNTTTSMGRLTLNVLLSFAQFEREVTGERIRDKIAASKQKGMWMGGWVPLGYDRKDRTLSINESEAKTVRTIFDLFLKLKNVREVQAELARLKLKTKPYAVRRGRATGNLAFARGHLYKILSNPIYVGRIEHKGVRHPGQHPALITQPTWDAVQAQLVQNSHANRSRSNAKSTSLLAGLIYNEAGNRLVSSHATKNGKRYRYYVTSGGSGRSEPRGEMTKLWLSATTIDETVVAGLQDFLRDTGTISKFLRKGRLRVAQLGNGINVASRLADLLQCEASPQKQAVVNQVIERVTAAPTNIKVSINCTELRAILSNTPLETGSQQASDEFLSIELPIAATGRSELTRLRIEGRSARQADPVVLRAMARAHLWFYELSMGKAQSMAEIALRENITDNYVSNLIHLAWLPPAIVDQILDGDPQATMIGRNAMHTRRFETEWSKKLQNIDLRCGFGPP